MKYLSGKAVNYWLQELKIPKENLLVLTDEIVLPFGTLRMRAKGSSAGHNGLKSRRVLDSSRVGKTTPGCGWE